MEAQRVYYMQFRNSSCILNTVKQGHQVIAHNWIRGHLQLISEGTTFSGEQLLVYKHPGGEVKRKAIADTIVNIHIWTQRICCPRKPYTGRLCSSHRIEASVLCVTVRMSGCHLLPTQKLLQSSKRKTDMFVDILSKWNSASLQVKEWMASMEYGHPGTQWLEIQPVVVILENCLEIFG